MLLALTRGCSPPRDFPNDHDDSDRVIAVRAMLESAPVRCGRDDVAQTPEYEGDASFVRMTSKGNNLRLTDVSSNHLALLSWVLERRGQDIAPILKVLGVHAPATNSPTDRVPLVTILKVMEHIDRLAGNPRTCLDLYGHMKLAHLNVLGFALSCSSNLLDLLLRAQRFSAYLGTAFLIKLDEHADHYQISGHWNPDIYQEQLKHAPNPSRLLECVGYAAVKMLQEAYGGVIPAKKLYLPGNPDVSIVKAFADVAECPIEAGSSFIGADIAKEVCLRRLPSANPELARINDQQLIDQMVAIDRTDIVHRCERVILAGLSNGKLSLKDTAPQLGMSERALQEALREKGQNFSDLVNRIRKTLAIQHLEEGRKSVSQIAYALGFDRPSNFSRAFRGWTGVSPREYTRKPT